MPSNELEIRVDCSTGLCVEGKYNFDVVVEMILFQAKTITVSLEIYLAEPFPVPIDTVYYVLGENALSVELRHFSTGDVSSGYLGVTPSGLSTVKTVAFNSQLAIASYTQDILQDKSFLVVHSSQIDTSLLGTYESTFTCTAVDKAQSPSQDIVVEYTFNIVVQFPKCDETYFLDPRPEPLIQSQLVTFDWPMPMPSDSTDSADGNNDPYDSVCGVRLIQVSFEGQDTLPSWITRYDSLLQVVAQGRTDLVGVY